MTSPSHSPSSCAGASSASSAFLKELQQEPTDGSSAARDGAGNDAPVDLRSNSLGHLLGNVPTGASGSDISQFDGPEDLPSDLDAALEELKKAYAEMMRRTASSNEETGVLELDSSDDMDIEEISRGQLPDSAASGLSVDTVYRFVQREMKLLDACWHRLLHRDFSIPLLTQTEQLERARQALDAHVLRAQKAESERKAGQLNAFVSRITDRSPMGSSNWDESNSKPSFDDVHTNFLEGNANLPSLKAAHACLMDYVRARLKLLKILVNDLTLQMSHVQQQCPSNTAELVPGTLENLEDAARRLPRGMQPQGARKELRTELAKVGKHVAPRRLAGWLMLVRPDIYLRYCPDLDRFKKGLLDAFSQQSSGTVTRESFSLLYTQVATDMGIGRQTLTALGNNLDLVHQYLALATKDRTIASETELPSDKNPVDHRAPIVRCAPVARNIRAAEELESAILSNAPAIVGYIASWRDKGFPVHFSELSALLTGMGITLSEKKLRVITKWVAGIERRGSWYCMTGEHPSLLIDVSLKSESTELFRGKLTSSSAKTDSEKGWCKIMRDDYPKGFTLEQGLEVIARMKPKKSRVSLHNVWDHWCTRRLLLESKNGLWKINPGILCGSARRPTTDNSEGEPTNKLATTTRSRKRTLRQSACDDLVFEKLLEMQLNGDLEDYHVRDAAGLAFNKPRLIDLLCRESGASAQRVTLALSDLRPRDLTEMALNKQWKKDRWKQDAVPDILRHLHKSFPFFVFLSHNRIAAEINRLWPDKYMAADCIEAFLENRSKQETSAEEEIKNLVRTKSIGFFYAGPAAKFVSPTAIRNHLAATKGIQIGTSELAAILKKYSSEILQQKPALGLKFEPRHVQKQLEGTIKHFKLQKGDSLPQWKLFSEHYEKSICKGKFPFYGKKAVELYLLLRDWLADESYETSAPPKKQKRRHLSNSDIGNTPAPVKQKRPQSSTPSAAVSASVTTTETTVPTASNTAPTLPGMPRDFDEFLQVYEALRPMAEPVRFAATSGGTATATQVEASASAAASLASLQAGFGDVPRSHVVDVRSELGAAGLVVRESPKDGDCLFTALLADHDLSAANAKALRGRIALLLQGIPDTAESNARNANSVANYLFQRDEQNGLAQSAGIHSVPNRVRALLESLDGVLSDPDLTLPLVCRLMDGAAVPGDAPVYVTLLSEDDGHAVIYTASERTAISLRGLAPIELQQTTRQLCAASAVTVILKNDHFDRVQPA